MECYNQNAAMHCAIYSTSYSIDKALLTNERQQNVKNTLIHPENYNLHELLLIFQQSDVIMVRRIWNMRDVNPTFSVFSLSLMFRFSPFYPSFIQCLTLSINIAFELFLLLKKCFCFDRKMEVEEQGHQDSTNWLRQ